MAGVSTTGAGAVWLVRRGNQHVGDRVGESLAQELSAKGYGHASEARAALQDIADPATRRALEHALEAAAYANSETFFRHGLPTTASHVGRYAGPVALTALGVGILTGFGE